jgi:sulfonate transport system permease protein
MSALAESIPSAAASGIPERLVESTTSKSQRADYLRACVILPWVLPLAVLVVWEVVSRLGWVAAHLLPPPSVLLDTLRELARDGSLWKHISISSGRVLAGFVIGAGLGLLIGALVALNRRVEILLDPSLQALRAVPSLAWVPLLLLWLGIDLAPKLTLIAIGTFFPMYLATLSSLKNVDRKLVEVGVQLGFSKAQLLRHIYLPCALPGVLTGLRAALGLGWMFLVAAELIAATSGLGYLLTDGRETGRADLVLIAIILLALLGKASDALLVKLENRLLIWRDVAQTDKNES